MEYFFQKRTATKKNWVRIGTYHNFLSYSSVVCIYNKMKVETVFIIVFWTFVQM